MAKPTNRQEFGAYCLRKLGFPLVELNVTEDQVDDRITQALSYYADYHFDGSERVYYKHRIETTDRPGTLKDVIIHDSGTGYSNSDTITISEGAGGLMTLTTDLAGAIVGFDIQEHGQRYSNTSVMTINTSTGSGANTSLVIGDGSITIPENILGVVHLFPIGDPAISQSDLFNINYQIALNDLYNLTSVSMIPYFMVRTHLSLIQEMLVGKQPIRYNRHMNKLYLDINWKKIKDGDYIIAEAYQVVDPEEYTDVWGDRWLQNYATALIKYQWGQNLTKYIGTPLLGGMQYNGERILTDAQTEIEKMEAEMITSYSLPALDILY